MRKKLFKSFIVIILIMILLTMAIVKGAVNNFGIGQYEKQYEDNITLLVDLIESADDYVKFSETYSERLGMRITIIDTNGVVIADSEKNPKDMDNHFSREEIEKAKNTGKVSHSIRKSSTLKVDYIYTAAPFTSSGEEWILRLSNPFMELESLINSLLKYMVTIFIIVGIITMFISWKMSSSFTLPIIQVTEAAKEISDGNYSRKIYYSDDNEIKKLVESFNKMTVNLKETVYMLEKKNFDLESVLNSMLNGIVAIDNDMKISYTNLLSKEMLNIDESAKDLSIHEIIRDSRVIEMIEEALKNKHEMYREIDDRKNNSFIYALTTSTIYASDNETVTGCILMIQDISKVKKLELMRSEFVSNVSHELKTPLTSIKGFVETLKYGAIEDKETAMRFLNIIELESERLYGLINDILVLSEIEGIPDDKNLSDKNIFTILTQVTELLMEKAKKAKIDIDVDVDESITLYCNSDRVKEALINIVDNAIIYSGGDNIKIDAYRKKDEICIDIIDNGVGIEKNHLDRLFERFYRVDKSRSREEGGTGLGLSIVKHTVMLYGGTVKVESDLGLGSKFMIRFKN